MIDHAVKAVAAIVLALLDTLEKEGAITVAAYPAFAEEMKRVLPAILAVDEGAGRFIKDFADELERIGPPVLRRRN